jgi:uncharacterized membrane-anchored protein YitT (DUF2179 family)
MGWLKRQREKQSELFNSIKKKNMARTIIFMLVGSFLSAASVNLFFVPNNFVTGGVTGLGIVANELTGMNVATFVFFGNVFMIGLGLIFLGSDKIIGSIFGSLLYSLFLFLTEDIAIWLNFSFDNILLYALAAGIVNGFAEALVYKIGYSTGGTSILGLIIAEKAKRPIGKVMRIISITIILVGGFTFGYTMVMYAIIIASISTFMIDKVTLGISDSKMFMVQTKKTEEVKEFIMQVIQSGVTEYTIKGGYSSFKKDMLMCVVPTEKYTYLKSAIKDIDKDAFIIVTDCYEVLGGTKRKKLTI